VILVNAGIVPTAEQRAMSVEPYTVATAHTSATPPPTALLTIVKFVIAILAVLNSVSPTQSSTPVTGAVTTYVVIAAYIAKNAYYISVRFATNTSTNVVLRMTRGLAKYVAESSGLAGAVVRSTAGSTNKSPRLVTAV
jgi:hypothetical protein